MLRFRSHSFQALILALTAGVAGVAGCDDEGPGKLFDESRGTFVLTAVTVDGGPFDTQRGTCNEAYMMRFLAKERIVVLAQDLTASGLADTFCGDGTVEYACNCFGYRFEDDQQWWQPFEAGDIPPEKVPKTEPSAPGDGDETGGDEGAGGAAEVYVVSVGEDSAINDQYIFRPLPPGVWESDGEISGYKLIRRAESAIAMSQCVDACTAGIP